MHNNTARAVRFNASMEVQSGAMNDTVQPGDAQHSTEMVLPDEVLQTDVMENENNELFESAKRCVEEIEGRFGSQSIVLADELEAYAQVLRTHKGSLIEAFNAESRAKVIRSNFNKEALHDDIARNLKKRAKRSAAPGANEPLICLIACLVCGALGTLMAGADGGCIGMILSSATWFKTVQWRVSRGWFVAGVLSLGLSDIGFCFTKWSRVWVAVVIQVAFLSILGCSEYMHANSPAAKDPTLAAARKESAQKQLQNLSAMFQKKQDNLPDNMRHSMANEQ